MTRIQTNDDGFALVGASGRESVEWVHVAEIVAYRRDPTDVDLLCLAFRLGQAGRYVEVNEEMAGYETLLEGMYDAFPEISRNWWKDVATGLGANRVTLYGLPAGEIERPSPAERYLEQIQRRKRLTRADWRRIAWAAAGLWILAGVQTFLTWLLGGWNLLVAFALLPVVLVVVAARNVRRPRTFFLLLAGFYLAEALWAAVWGRWGASLPGRLFGGHFSWLLLLGVEILLGMGVMLLPNRRAAGPRLR